MNDWRDLIDPAAPAGRYLAWKEVQFMTSISRTTAWRLQRRGEFPRPYTISPGRVGYREDEVQAWRLSRDHSATRLQGTRPLAPSATPSDAPAPRLPPEAAQDRGEHPAAPKARGPAEGPVIPSPPPQPGLRPPTRNAGRARRRSQHAKAIAQQMRFDF